jgi:hypothetical protein
MRSVLTSFFFLSVAVATGGCDNGTTSAPLPLYEASVEDAGTFVVADAATDARPKDAAVDAKDASQVDSGQVDGGHDATPGGDAGVDSGQASDAAHDAGHDATSDGAQDAASDAPADVNADAHG